MQKLSQRFRAGLAAAALLASMVPFGPASAVFTQRDVLIKAPGNGGAVYYLANDGRRYVFPNQKTYNTWFANFTNVQSVTLDELISFPLGGNVTYRPGIRLVKITTDPKVYAVDANGTLRWVSSQSLAKTLYGDNWNTKIDDVPDAFFTNYRIGADLYSSADYNPFTVANRSTSINGDKGISNGGNPRLSDTYPIAPNQPVTPDPVPVIVPPSASTCTADVWVCTEWASCDSSGQQTRSCSLSTDCPQSTSSSPALIQSCTATSISAPTNYGGTISVAGTSDAGSVVSGTRTVLAKFRLSASYEDLRLTKASFNVATPAAVLTLRLYDGETPVSSEASVDGNGDAFFSGVDFVVPRNTSKDLTVRGLINTVGTSGVPTGSNARVTMKDTGGGYVFEMRGAQPSSNTLLTHIPGGDRNGNDKFVHKSMPTVSLVSLPSTVFTPGTVTAARVNIAASGIGDLALKTLTLNVQKPSGVTITLAGDSTHTTIRPSNDSSYIAGHSSMSGCGSGSTFCQIRSKFDSEYGINVGDSKTLDFRLGVSGAIVRGDALVSVLEGDTDTVSGTLTNGSETDQVRVHGTNVNFAWTDDSAASHKYDVGSSSADWSSGAYIKILPTDSQVLVK